MLPEEFPSMTLAELQKRPPKKSTKVFWSLVVVGIVFVLIIHRLLFPVYDLIINSHDTTLTSYQAFVFPVFVDSSGNVRTLTGYMTYPSGGGMYAETDTINHPWPIVPAKMTFQWKRSARKIGWVVRRERPEIAEPDNSDVRVFWMPPDELQQSVKAGEVLLPEFDRMERFDLSQLSK